MSNTERWERIRELQTLRGDSDRFFPIEEWDELRRLQQEEEAEKQIQDEKYREVARWYDKTYNGGNDYLVKMVGTAEIYEPLYRGGGASTCRGILTLLLKFKEDLLKENNE